MQLYKSKYSINIGVILITVVFLACYTACSKEENNDVVSVSIAMPTHEIIHYSDLIDSISYIQLQSVEDNPIGKIKTLKFLDSLMVVFDEKTQRVMLYGSDGSFYHQIGSQGQGPGEYVYCQQIDADRCKRHVLVYDIAMGVAKRYDLKGNYLGEDTVGRADDIAYIGNHQYLIANYEEERDANAGIFHVTSTPFNAKKIRGCRDHIAIGKPFEFFDRDGSPSIMTRSYEDVVLHWTGDSLTSVANFDIEENPTKSQINDMKQCLQFRMEILDRVQFYNYDNCILLYFNYKKEGRYLIFDKTNKSVEVVKAVVNDIDSIYGYRLPVSLGNTVVNIVDEDEDLAPKIQLLHLK